MGAVWSLELLKLRRSTMARLITPLLIVLVPLGSVGAVALARSPSLPGSAAAKFAPYAVGDLMTNHLLVVGQIMSVAVLTAGGFAAAWSYGREFVAGTAGALAGLTAPRWTVGLVKALLLALWLIACHAAALVVTVLLSLGRRRTTGRRGRAPGCDCHGRGPARHRTRAAFRLGCHPDP